MLVHDIADPEGNHYGSEASSLWKEEQSNKSFPQRFILG
jgi:hypothetical protein